MIQIENLSKNYGKNQVLRGITLRLEKGKAYGFVGDNGSGKTTLFKCISGIETHEGNILSDLSNIKNHLGYLQTTPVFLSRITGWEYLKLLCVSRQINEDNFEEQNIFELPLREYAENYSTGMKKKLALTALLLQKNELFILDEPFSGVDLHSNIKILQIIQDLKEQGKTLLISSHILSTLTDSCDIIYELKDGLLQEFKTR